MTRLLPYYLLPALLIAGCAAPPRPDPAPVQTPRPAEPTPGVRVQPLPESEPFRAQPAPPPAPDHPAALALADRAQGYRLAGQLERAAATLERALRIEPRSARLWLQLAQVHYLDNAFGQSESLARRAVDLAGSDRDLKAQSWRLVAAARSARGDRDGADAAAARATLLERGR